MPEAEDDALQRICEEVEAEWNYGGLATEGDIYSDFAKAVARRYAATVGAGVPDQWRPITGSDKIGRLRTRLLIARYPQSNGWTDAYTGWWDPKERKWTRWPHDFPPTHCMCIGVPADGPCAVQAV